MRAHALARGAAEGDPALLRVGGQWYASGVAADPAGLPAGFTSALEQGDAAHQRVTRVGQPRLLIGSPLAPVDALYVEIVPLDTLERTFRALAVSLVIGSLGTTVVGTFVGLSISRRVLRPVNVMSASAVPRSRSSKAASATVRKW